MELKVLTQRKKEAISVMQIQSQNSYLDFKLDKRITRL